MGRGTSGDVFAVVLIAVAATLIFAAVGLWLNRRQRMLKRPVAAFLWAMLTLAPLLAAGMLVFGTRVMEQTDEPARVR